MFFILSSYFKNIFVFVLLLFLAVIPLRSAYSQFNCLPTCDITDARFMSLVGSNLVTTNNTDAFFHITSIAGDDEFEIGVFDGDAIGRWDISNDTGAAELEYTLFFDPDGDGTGTGNGVVYATWSSDGSFGDNIGSPMPDNDWFIAVLPNDPQAMTNLASFSYVLRIVNINTPATALNAFKVRSDSLLTLPAGEAFNYVGQQFGLEDFQTIYPNFVLDDPECFNPAPTAMGGFGIRLFCDQTDPDCCLNETTYDGSWDFYFNLPENINTLDIWDGDLDYGSASANADATLCINPDGVNVDTDDPNTPIPLPPWAIGTDAITQGESSPTNPPDDNDCSPAANRPPSVIYELVDPNGLSYLNENPSGNIEWELFNLSTEPFDPTLYDIHVDDIPTGLWEIRITGNNLQNQNSMRVPYEICGMDEQGLPVCRPTNFVLNPVFPALDDNINSISAENATPNGNVAFVWGKYPGSFTVSGGICNGIELGIENPKLFAVERANEFGIPTYIFYIPTFNNLQFAIQLQAIDIETCRVSNQIEQIIRKDESG